MASKANRDGVAERCPAPAGHKSIAVDRARLGHYDQLRRDMELSILTTATQHDANTLSLLRTVPGIGEVVRLGLLYEIPNLARFPRVPDCVSYGRLVTCAKASAGKRSGTSGPTSGHAYLTWAFSAAAVVLLRAHPAGQTYRTRLAKKPGTGKAVTVLAHT